MRAGSGDDVHEPARGRAEGRAGAGGGEAAARAPGAGARTSEIWEARHGGGGWWRSSRATSKKTRVATVLALLQAEVPEKRSFACRQPIMVRPLYRMTELTEMGRAFRAAHPAP